ncbi:hypothetical protein BCF74_10258 [Knoellia remsis]|uniref:Uncharacterized protein n=1 Tax=Knoellia remsis TaxID=407159 RepID=A0A2T0UZE0_9MICO|nr:hypothetical protein BCF74_10258 [Knoellia remsis]
MVERGSRHRPVKEVAGDSAFEKCEFEICSVRNAGGHASHDSLKVVGDHITAVTRTPEANERHARVA